MAQQQTVAVIGGGVAGLTSALILARAGHAVTLVEKSSRLGLTLRGFSREGVYFDTGLHYTGGLAENGIVSRYLRYLGVDAPGVVAFERDGFDEVRFADIGKTVRLPVGYEAMVRALLDNFPEEERCVTAYMEAARADFQASSLLNFFLSTRDSARERDAVPLDTFLRDLTDDAHLRCVLSIHSLLYGVSPVEVPFTQHAYVSASYFDSVHNFSGGGGALIRAMEDRLRELGVTILCGRAVTRLICEGGRNLTRLELEDGTRIETDAVVCTAHPSALADMGEGAFRPVYVDHLRSLEETSSAYMLFGIAEKKPECLKGRNLFLCHDPELAGSFSPSILPGRGPFYVASSPQPGPQPGPHNGGQEGRTGIVVLTPGSFDSVREWEDSRLGRRPEGYKRHKAEAMRRIRESLLEIAPELADVRFVDGATPLTMRDYLQTPDGSLYGSKHTVDQLNPMPVTRIPNLWLAGQSVLAPGLMGAMISAFLACGFFLGHTTLHEEAACS